MEGGGFLFKASLENNNIPELGTVTVEFPIPEAQYEETIRALNGIQSGAVVEQADVPAFSDAIARLCERRNEMREGCLRRAARFDSGNTFRAYVDLYKELLR